MKGEESKPRANITDSKLSLRNGGGKAAKFPIPPKKLPPPLSDLEFFKWKTFMKQFRAKYPNNASPFDLHDAALVEWKTMSDADKAPYGAMAEESMKEFCERRKEFRKRFKEYCKCLLAAYDKNNQAATNVEEEVRINLAGLMIRQ